ncbi:MAG: RpiB/LacA/LacB family sugar-phosphate isomerase, partial [Chloroflexota bacterium]
GTDSAENRTDYTDAARAVGNAVVAEEVERGILVCGSGVGASIAANKIKGVYCAITHDAYSAAQGVQHDNMNVMAIGGRVIGTATAESLADAFISATFQTDTERYVRRFKDVQSMEAGD